jgi:hypothetical protein
MNFQPGLLMNSEQKLMFIPSASDSSKPNVEPTPTVKDANFTLKIRTYFFI